MLQAIRNRITPSTIIATLALVFAMTGGAYAAKKYLITSTKQIKPSVIAQLKGKNGKTGVNGANGTNGAQGPVGEKGPAGTNGTSGKEGPAGPKGLTGAPGTFGSQPLPSGQSLTGVWSVRNAVSGQETWASISYPIQVSPAPTAWFILPSGEEGLEVGGTTAILATKAEVEAVCPGTPASPTAVKGNLCVYVAEESSYFFEAVLSKAMGASPEPKSGVQLPFGTAEGVARGSWAVTAG
jgi:Collagen triple helix repeat (20 copies)